MCVYIQCVVLIYFKTLKGKKETIIPTKIYHITLYNNSNYLLVELICRKSLNITFKYLHVMLYFI